MFMSLFVVIIIYLCADFSELTLQNYILVPGDCILYFVSLVVSWWLGRDYLST